MKNYFKYLLPVVLVVVLIMPITAKGGHDRGNSGANQRFNGANQGLASAIGSIAITTCNLVP